MHTAATVLIAASKSPSFRAKVGEKCLEQAWQEAMMILERSESPSISARPWIEHLQRMRQTAMEQQAQMPNGQSSEQRSIPLQIFGEDATGSSFPTSRDDFAFYSSDLMGLEDLDWSLLDTAPLGRL